MKTRNLTTIILFIFTLFTLKSKAQTLPLNTSMFDIPQNAYVKDLNNELLPYVGTYKSSFLGKETILYITKEENKPTERLRKKFYRDALVIKYIVKNSSGTILQNNSMNSKIELYSIATKPDENSIIFTYSGTNCGVGWGKIILKKLNSTQISWEYLPNDTILDNSKCPAGTDITIYLPETKGLIFTKQ